MVHHGDSCQIGHDHFGGFCLASSRLAGDDDGLARNFLASEIPRVVHQFLIAAIC